MPLPTGYPSGGGDGIAWYVELDDASQTLASGINDRGGPPTGNRALASISIAAGQQLNFVVDSNGDNRCDWTQLEASIVTKEA